MKNCRPADLKTGRLSFGSKNPGDSGNNLDFDINRSQNNFIMFTLTDFMPLVSFYTS